MNTIPVISSDSTAPLYIESDTTRSGEYATDSGAVEYARDSNGHILLDTRGDPVVAVDSLGNA